MTEQLGAKPVVPPGPNLFLVRDELTSDEMWCPTLQAATEEADRRLDEYQEVCDDGGYWPGDGNIDVLQVIRRHRLTPVPTPPGEEGPWVDMLLAEVPPVFTLEEIEEAAYRAASVTSERLQHPTIPALRSPEADTFVRRLKFCLQESREGGAQP